MKNPADLRLKPALSMLFALGCAALPACQARPEAQDWQWSEPAFAGIPDAGDLAELSGLTRSNAHPGLFWAVNDSSNRAEVVAIDAQARTRAVLMLEGIANTDWEDIASYRLDGRNYLAIADTGDNGGLRTELFIHSLEEPEQLRSAAAKPRRSLRFTWPDGARDSEALFASGEHRAFYLISKKRVPAELYRLPFDAADGSAPVLLARLEGIIQPDAKTMNSKGDYGRYRSQITGADLSPDGRVFAVLNYQHVYFFELPQQPVAGIRPLARITLPWLPQAEGIAFSEDGNSLFIGSEQAPTPVIRFDRLRD